MFASSAKLKKVCITTPEYPPEQWGGLARTVGRVAAHVRDMGLDVHVAHLVVSSEPVVLLDENRVTRRIDGITVHRIGVAKERLSEDGRDLWDCPHTLTLQMMYQSLEQLYGHEHFDCFHSFFLYPVGYITGLLSRRMRTRSVVTVVGNDIKKYPFSPEKAGVCRSGLENADLVVALSSDLMEMADALASVSKKSKIIYNSVQIPDVRWKPGVTHAGEFRIGCAAIFKYAKGLPYLFKALARLRECRRVVLELRGSLRPSERETYEEMVDRTGTRSAIRMLDPLPHAAIPGWLSGLDSFVLPSVSEGCPNILMEALAAGVPCVATLTGANTELIEDRVSGLLVPWGDSDALARALGEIMDSPELAAQWGASGRERMKAFSAARERQAWEGVYRELVDVSR
jgi:L-malate glycosyltransferase